jgi:uncharacterized protein YegP (UPF0339 family)
MTTNRGRRPVGHVKFYKDKKGEWRWGAFASNGNVVATSGEGYKRRVDAKKGADAALRVLTSWRRLEAKAAQ